MTEREVSTDPSVAGFHRRNRTVWRRARGRRTDRGGRGTFHGMERPPLEDKVVRSFIRDGRLVSIPRRQTKRDVVLRYLLDRCFPEDRSYPEPEVNQRLALYHPDVAALRRYLVDSGMMIRASGEYGEPEDRAQPARARRARGARGAATDAVGA